MKNIKPFMALLFSSLLSFNLSAQTAAGENPGSSKETPVALVARIPIRQIKRSGTIPVGVIQAQTNLSMEKLKAITWDASATFGIIRKVHGEVGLAGFQFNEFKVKQFVKLGAKYNYLSIPHVGFSASVALPIYIMEGEIIKDVTFGLPVGFKNDLMAVGILGDVFKLTMRPKADAQFNFLFWYGIQFYDNWYAKLDSSFGNIKTVRKDNQVKWIADGFWQELPAKLSVSYAVNHYFDLGANFGFRDVIKAKDTIIFGLTITARGGSLFG